MNNVPATQTPRNDAHTPTLPLRFSDEQTGQDRAYDIEDAHGMWIASVPVGPNAAETAAFIVRARNEYAGLVLERDACRQTMAALVEALDKMQEAATLANCQATVRNQQLDAAIFEARSVLSLARVKSL